LPLRVRDTSGRFLVRAFPPPYDPVPGVRERDVASVLHPLLRRAQWIPAPVRSGYPALSLAGRSFAGLTRRYSGGRMGMDAVCFSNITRWFTSNSSRAL